MCFGFAVSGAVWVTYRHDNNPVRDVVFNALYSIVRAVFLVFDFLKVSRVLMMYSVAFLSGIMIIEKLCIVKLAVIPVFFICL